MTQFQQAGGICLEREVGKAEIRKFEVKMFGGFLLTDDKGILLEDKQRSRKLWNLLEYLIMHHNGSITSEGLVELLCKEDSSSNPANAVKNIVYRLRKMLTEMGLPGEQCVLFLDGAYCWNIEFALEIDVEQFEENYKMSAKIGISEQEQLEYLLTAINLYEGKLLSNSSASEWALSIAARYHNIYLDCISRAYERLTNRKSHERLISICNKAVEIDPFDEGLYEMLILGLIKLDRHREALMAYEKITGLLFNELGVNPSQKLKGLYHEIIKTIKNAETDLVVIKQELDEVGGKNGAYYCNYEVFKDSYRFVARTVERTGQSVYVMLCTLTNQNSGTPDVSRIKGVMEKLYSSIFNSLRKGDLFARYSSTQYVIMLTGITYENGLRVGRRIDANFKKMFHTKNEIMNFKLTPLDPSE